MQTNDGLDVGAGARELQHIAAAEAEADRGLPREIADLALVAFARAAHRARRSMRRRRSGASARSPLANSADSGGPALTLPPPYMSATKATYLPPAIVAARLMASSVTPSQFGAISSSGRRPLTLFIIDQRAVARSIARPIFDPLDRHRFPPLSFYSRMISPISPASYCVK